MARIYNIASKMKTEKPIIVIDDKHQYEVDNTKTAMLLIQELERKEAISDMDRIDMIIKIALKEKALKYINTLDLSLDAYKTLINAIVAAMGNEDMEVIEEAAKNKMPYSR